MSLTFPYKTVTHNERDEVPGMNSAEPPIITASIVPAEIITAEILPSPVEEMVATSPIAALSISSPVVRDKQSRTWGTLAVAIFWGVLNIPFRLFQFASLLLLLDRKSVV